MAKAPPSATCPLAWPEITPGKSSSSGTFPVALAWLHPLGCGEVQGVFTPSSCRLVFQAL